MTEALRNHPASDQINQQLLDLIREKIGESGKSKYFSDGMRNYGLHLAGEDIRDPNLIAGVSITIPGNGERSFSVTRQVYIFGQSDVYGGGLGSAYGLSGRDHTETNRFARQVAALRNRNLRYLSQSQADWLIDSIQSPSFLPV